MPAKQHQSGTKRWLSLPKLDGVRWVWADDWWDWILSGVCEYQGKRYYAVCVDENRKRRQAWYRRFLMVDLPEEIWHEENERHAFFVEKVGSHFDFDAEGRRRISEGLKPEHICREFYERYPPPYAGGEQRDYKQYPWVGWFEN